MSNRVFLPLFFLVASVAFPQAAAIDGQIEGIVRDPAGAAVTNADVKAHNLRTGLEREVKTNGDGYFRFSVLPRGEYEVIASSSGFNTVKQTGIILNAGTTATINIDLGLASAATEIVVSSSGPVTEPGRTDIGSTLSNLQVQNLPLVSRNPYNFIFYQPNVTGRPNTEFGVPRKINANGFTGRINYQLDGANNVQSDRAGIRLIPISNTFVEEVQSVSNAFAPEFGNTVGTVFNTITRSGTNDFHGEGAYIFRRTDFNATPALQREGTPKPLINVDSFYGNGGGRIIKDKLFFYGAYEKVKRDLPSVVTVSPTILAQVGLPASFADPIPFKQNVQFFMAKVDYQINDSNRLVVRFNGHRNTSPYNSGGGITVVSRTYNFVDRSNVGYVQLISTLSPNIVNEARFQTPWRSQQQQAFEATGTGPSINITGLVQFGRSEGTGFDYTEMTPEYNDNLSINSGKHSYKFGFSGRHIRDQQVQATFARYTFANIQSYLDTKNGITPTGYQNFQQTIGEPSIKYNSFFYGFYAQDSYKPRPNITLTYGLRYDTYSIPSANGQSPFAPSQKFRIDRNNFAPRVGLAWALGKDQKTVFRASAGIFFDPPQTDVYRRALLNNGSPIFFNVTSPAVTPSFPSILTSIPTGFNLPIQSIDTISPDFASLYSSNFNLSLTRQITAKTAITATYLFTRGNRLPIYRNINLLPSGNTLADGRPIWISTAGVRIDPRFNNIMSVESVGQSTYSGGTLTLNRRFGAGFEAFASYTWSHAIDDAPEQNNIDSGAFLLSDLSNRRRDKGNSLTDRRHSLQASGVYQPVFDTDSKFLQYLLKNNRLGYTITAISGDIFNIGSNLILNNDQSTGGAFQRPLFIGRNTYRGPATYQLDIRYSRIFPIKERYKAEFFAESTNLFNHTNVTGVNTTATVNVAGVITAPPTYAWTSAIDQRLIQLGFKFNF
ncbi:TonB-dependent receptor [Bryobacter aggregatus]|uniref:TonB-dependent receptor n=1 Tax=Bryobacter aggregatus TaxID=360054 RepID=UPI0004E183C9|nr:TonB-dependent receptor [Bryobacter aggregatus]